MLTITLHDVEFLQTNIKTKSTKYDKGLSVLEVNIIGLMHVSVSFHA